MKLTDKLIEKVGADKLLHFLTAAWIVAECKTYSITAGCISFITVLLLSFIKEKWLDKRFNARDFLWSAIGGFTSLVLMVIKDVISQTAIA